MCSSTFVLVQALLPRVTGAFSEEEKEAMMGSLREATTQCISNLCLCNLFCVHAMLPWVTSLAPYTQCMLTIHCFLTFVLMQALLPWVTGVFSEEEKEAMMGSLREASTQRIANLCLCNLLLVQALLPWALQELGWTCAATFHVHCFTCSTVHLFCVQALLPWVTGSFSEEEKEAMMGSLREATKNTMFDQWLGAVQQSGAAAAATAAGGGATDDQQGPTAAGAGAVAGPEQQQQQQQQQQMPMSDLAEIAEYLTGSGSLPQLQQQQQLPLGSVPPALHQQQCLTEVSGTVAESTNYVPGWEDIFNINQKQLEAAIRRVSNDPNLEPQRKAYLIQNIMVSRYIVAQQRRMQTGGSSAGAAAAGQMLPPPVQHQHVHAHAHGHVDGSCCHHDADRQQQQQQHVHAQQQQQQHNVQVQAGSSSSSSAVVALQQQQQQQQPPVRTFADAAAGVLGCKHYRRSAQLVAPCCGKVFTCR
jgi:hypothetical protein